MGANAQVFNYNHDPETLLFNNSSQYISVLFKEIQNNDYLILSIVYDSIYQHSTYFHYHSVL